jgi:hypothetical protein
MENTAPLTSSRAAQIADLEAQVDPSLPDSIEAARAQARALNNVPELSKPKAPVDGRSVKGILDQPPAVGINPRFRPVNR